MNPIPPFQIRKEAWIWLIVILPVIVFMIVHKRLPDKIPSHYNLQGRADAYQSPLAFLLFAGGTNLFIYFLLLFVPRIDPKKASYPLFAKTYYIIRIVVHLVMTAIFCLSLMAALGTVMNIPRLIPLAVLLLFTVLGNYLGNVRPNWFVGIRTPWTLSNETVWRKTHQLGGRLMFFSGLTGFILALFASQSFLNVIVIAAVVIGAIVPAVYSYFEYRKIENSNTNS